jgi:outer membrane receptor protein involved in Fe transport
VDAIGQTSNGLFASADVRLADRVRATVGLRGDLYRFDVRAGDPRNSGQEWAGLVSPKGGLVLGPWAKTEIYLNAGRGFHSNDARGATMTVDPSTGEPAERVTPLARANGAEVGLRSVIVPHVQTTLAIWRLDLASELVFVGDAGTTDAGRPSHRDGVEWATFLKPRSWLTMDVDLALSRARFRDDDPVGPFIPGSVETVVSAGAAVDGPWRVSGGLRWRYFGGRPLVEDDSVRSRATSLLNGDVALRLSPRARLRLDGFNLLDSAASDIDYFYASRLPGEPDGGIEGLHTHPAIPRTVRLGLEVRF